MAGVSGDGLQPLKNFSQQTPSSFQKSRIFAARLEQQI
jgi:hypothetical protein